MSQKTIKGTSMLGNTIKSRRQELGLTIEEAASRAGVGTKSWCRYESGESIRSDKAKGICKALNWHAFPYNDDTSGFDIEYYRNHDAWSPYLCEQYGEAAAISFIIGSDILLDYIEDDLNNLSTMPKGTHIGQLSISMLKDALPEQFLIRYDYEFLYQLKTTVISLRQIAASGKAFLAHSVLEELAIYLFMKESSFLINCMSADMEAEGIDIDTREDWAFDLFDDTDILLFLFSDFYLTEGDTYHFDNWSKRQFFVEDQEGYVC